MKSATPRVAALMTTILSDPQKLEQSVAATVAAAKSAGVEFEVICILNEPRIPAPILENCRVVSAGLNLGYAGGLQLARSLTAAEILWVVQDDMTFEANLLTELLAELDRHPNAGVVSPTVKDLNSRTTQVRGGQFDVHRDEQIWHPMLKGPRLSPKRLPNLNWLSLAGAIIPARAWDEVAGPDAAFFPLQYVDIDFGFRLSKAGYKMVPCLGATIQHEFGGSSNGIMKRFLNMDADRRMRNKHGANSELSPAALVSEHAGYQPEQVMAPPEILEQVARSATLGFVDLARFANREVNLLRSELAVATGAVIPDDQAAELSVANQHLKLRSDLEAIRNSVSWRITAPLRWAGMAVARLLRR